MTSLRWAVCVSCLVLGVGCSGAPMRADGGPGGGAGGGGGAMGGGGGGGLDAGMMPNDAGMMTMDAGQVEPHTLVLTYVEGTPSSMSVSKLAWGNVEDGAVQMTNLTVPSGTILYPSLSPDQEKVVFVLRPPGGGSTLQVADGQATTQLYACPSAPYDNGCSQPVVASDGNVYFWEHSGTDMMPGPQLLRIIPLAGGMPITFLSVDAQCVVGLSAAPGRRVLVVSARGEMCPMMDRTEVLYDVTDRNSIATGTQVGALTDMWELGYRPATNSARTEFFELARKDTAVKLVKYSVASPTPTDVTTFTNTLMEVFSPIGPLLTATENPDVWVSGASYFQVTPGQPTTLTRFTGVPANWTVLGADYE